MMTNLSSFQLGYICPCVCVSANAADSLYPRQKREMDRVGYGFVELGREG